MILIVQLVFAFSLSALVYSFCIYPLLLALFSRFNKNKLLIATNHIFPTITFIVPAYNEQDVIVAKIRNILSLDYPAEKLSVLVGSDQSTDRTNELVAAIDDPRVRLWVALKREGKSQILNNLVPLATSEIVVLTDANTFHTKDSLSVLVRHFADPSVGGVAGDIRHQINTSDAEEVVYRNFESYLKNLESRLHSTISAFGGFYAVRRSLFRPIPANAYSNDDVLIPMSIIRQGFRMLFDPAAISTEDATGNIGQEFSRRIRIGAGNFQAFFWLLDFLLPSKGWPWFCYLSHKVTRWFTPFFLIGAFFSCLLLVFFSPSGNPGMISLLVAMVLVLLAGVSYKIIPLRVTRPLYYFLSMSTALFLGFFRFLRGIKSATWTRTNRTT